MGNDVKVGVSASTSQATQQLNRLNQSLKDLKKTREELSRAFGRPISDQDTERFAQEFERYQTGAGRRSRVGAFPDFESWMRDSHELFRSRHEAEVHRRRVLNEVSIRSGMDYRIPSEPGHQQHGGQGHGHGVGGRAKHMLRHYGPHMLALAGIGSVMGMTEKGIDLAKEEAIGVGELKKVLGDTKNDFYKLRDALRENADGLGVNYSKFTELSTAYSKTANMYKAEYAAKETRTAVGFARAYGISNDSSVEMFATMRHLGVTKDDAGNKRLALMIAEAMQKGGIIAKADELISAVGNFAESSARQGLSTPNVGAYIALMAGMTSPHYAGLDPTGAANLIGHADAAVRRGGARGEASLNFMYGIMNRVSPGINPFMAQLIWESQGLLGDAGSLGEGNLIYDWAKKNGLAGQLGAFKGQNMYGLTENALRSNYKNPLWRMAARAGHYGLSMPQSVAMEMLGPESLGNLNAMFSKNSIDPSNVKATGYQLLADIAGTTDREKLLAIGEKMHGMAKDKKAFGAILAQAKRGDTGELQDTLFRQAAGMEQEQTAGTQTVQSLANVERALTHPGAPLLDVLNQIKLGISGLFVGEERAYDVPPRGRGATSRSNSGSHSRPMPTEMQDEVIPQTIPQYTAPGAGGAAPTVIIDKVEINGEFRADTEAGKVSGTALNPRLSPPRTSGAPVRGGG